MRDRNIPGMEFGAGDKPEFFIVPDAFGVREEESAVEVFGFFECGMHEKGIKSDISVVGVRHYRSYLSK